MGFYTKDFYDVLDWQADIGLFDLHSIGATVVNPHWAEPRFVSVLRDDFRVYEPVALQRFTSPTVDAGNSLSDNGQKPGGYTNILANPGFESDFDSGLFGWETSAGASVRTSSPVAYEGSNYFSAGSVESGFARQVLDLADLTALGYSRPSSIPNLEVLYGRRVRFASKTSRPVC